MPIGTYNNPYAGNFDGQGHTISGLTVTGTADYVGLFGKIYHARIWNVGIADSSFQGNKYVGGICGQAYNGNSGYTEIGNCYSTATVSGSSYVGGFCGMNQYAAIFNSFSAATVTGEDSFNGMFCGASLNLLELNCYYLSENENGASGYCRTQEEFASGKVAYNLAKGFQYFSNFKSGDIWGQRIGSDGLPVFNGAKVEYSQRQYHNHTGDYCEICAGEPKSDNGVYQLYTADDLYWNNSRRNGYELP